MRNKPQNLIDKIAFIAAIIISIFLSIQSRAQDSAVAKYDIHRLSFGIGLGIDYGGLRPPLNRSTTDERIATMRL
jgi:hypothetical protein